MRLGLTLILFLSTILCLPAVAEPEVALAEPHIDTIEDIAWLVGTWEGEHFGERAVTTLGTPTGNVIAGSYRVVNAEGICTIIEMDCIEATDTGLYWHYVIFGPGMEPMESPFGQKGKYRMQVVSDTKVLMLDEAGKLPIRDSYIELLPDGRLKSSVTFVGEEGEQLIEFFSTRVE